MNYRHAFHAGGFADVIKHIVLVRMLTYLQEKPAAFRVIDTHAGAGRYDLSGDEARRGGEWPMGIARMMQARFSDSALPVIAPYLDIVRAFNQPGEIKVYPGSPLIARALLSLPAPLLRLMAGGGVVYKGGRTLDPRLQFLAAPGRIFLRDREEIPTRGGRATDVDPEGCANADDGNHHDRNEKEAGHQRGSIV